MHPIIFRIGPLTLYSYGLALAVAFVVATLIVYNSAKTEGLDTTKLLDLGFYGILFGIIGSRILYILQNPSEFIASPLRIFMLWEGGLVFYGGILGGILATIFLLKKYRLPFWKTMDVLAPPLVLAQAIGRVGCFMAGCCYGKPSGLPWAVTFNNPNTLAQKGFSLHPTQLYHSIANLIIFCILFFFVRKRKQFNGQIFCLYLCMYPFARFFIEFFRGDLKIHLTGPLNLTQGFSIIIFLIGVFFYWRLKINNKANGP
jgi:phosphatidylglycerol:prolipoprotein diacylglycerol transferase